ncbi:MAG: hypothetical protein IT243_03515 [Bacteroidia bacterium]|nr:hypothetical protein [Bacteroidia bacterium]
MIIKNLADNLIYPLKPSDTAGFALESFDILKQDILPVAENNALIGYLLKKDLEKIKKNQVIKPVITTNYNFEINENRHFYDAIIFLLRDNAPYLVTVNNDNQYTGNISYKCIINYLANSYTLQAEGSVINLKLQSYNYSLNEINRIIESEDAKIIGLNIFKVTDTNLIILSIKLNTKYIDRIVFSLQRFGYEITDTFNNKSYVNDVEDRYHSLVKYLEL